MASMRRPARVQARGFDHLVRTKHVIHGRSFLLLGISVANVLIANVMGIRWRIARHQSGRRERP